MNVKLTLTIDDAIIDQAKDYAKGEGRSLSDIVENYLKLLVKGESKIDRGTPIVRSLRGSFKVPDNFDYEKTLEDELTKKYL